MPWSRDTKWRQGSVLASSSFSVLGFSNDEEEKLAIAISHDCDITNDSLEIEPVIEFMLGKLVDEKNGNYEFGKNPRILHLPVTFNGGRTYLELLANQKHAVRKRDLCAHEPDDSFALDAKPRQILQGWLAFRYRRQTLPDALVERLRPIFNFLEKQGKKYPSGILGYWLDYHPREIDLQPNEPYELWLNIVYSIDDPDYEADATKVATALNDTFDQLTKTTANLGPVDLRQCKAYSEEEFTLRDLRGTIEYQLEYISHRSRAVYSL